MKTWSIKKKLVSLCAFLLTLTLIVGGVGYFGLLALGDAVTNLADVQLSAIHYSNAADAAHEGLRAVGFKAIFAADSGDELKKKEVTDELKAYTEDLNKSLAQMDELPLPDNAKSALIESKKSADAYIKSTEDIVALCFSGHRRTATAKIDDYHVSYKKLDDDLNNVTGIVQKNADLRQVDAEKKAQLTKITSGLLCFAGLLFGVLISFWLVNDLLKSLGKVIEQMTRSSQEVSDASSQSASSATELSEASTEQAASLQETMASVEEISAMVSQNAESAVKVKSAVDTNQHVANDGSRSVDDMVRAIDEIKSTNETILSQMQSSNKEFSEIVKIISEIGDKTKVINDIVFQTKLLSFNASVEAARAGEHGKGFAVVAEEVGNLAQMSGNAAKQITDMLSDSIKKVNKIVDDTTERVDHLVEIGKDKISMGQSTALKCRLALTKISENAQTMTTMITEITHASKEQAQGIQEINKAIGQLDQVTQQTSAVAQQSSAQAEQLNLEAQSLSGAVGDLVKFVSGHDAIIQASAAPVAVTAAKPVTFLNTQKKNKTAYRPLQKPLKKASGSPDVPASDDPNFEEF